MDKSVPRVTVWHHLAEPRDSKTMPLGTDLPICASHSCQILIVYSLPSKHRRCSRLYTHGKKLGNTSCVTRVNFGLKFSYNLNMY